jgi:hypothetical protein
MQTVASATVTGAGVGYSSTTFAGITSVGGVPPASAITASPDAFGLSWKPRPLQAGIQVAGTATTTLTAGQAATIFDGGLFEGVPNVVLLPLSGTAPSTLATLALVMGSRPDIAILQPAP